MRLLLSVVLLAVGLSALAQDDAEKQIGSALGMRLGKKFSAPAEGKDKKDSKDTKAAPKTITDRDGTVFQVYTPPKTHEPFTEYLVCVTPTTKVVAQILARAKLASKDVATAERDKLMKALEKRYGSRSGGGDPLANLATMLDGAVIMQGTRYVMVTVEPEGTQFVLCLRYADKALTAKVKDEHLEFERGRDLNPGEKLPNNAL